MPSSRSRAAELDALIAVPFAHRGLHGAGVPENSRAAFEAAIARGHGIEFDVQASRSGGACVFHDYELDRLTGESGPLAERSLDELGRIRLGGSRETVPSLEEILALVGARAPLLIEVKAPRRGLASLCAAIASALDCHAGQVGLMSFSPRIPRWFRRHRPGLPRGLVVTEEGKKNWRGRIERRLSLGYAAPDFLGYDIRDLPSPFAAAARARGLPVLTWTVKSESNRKAAAEFADQIIYEERP